MTQTYAYVNDASLQGAAEGSAVALQATKRGELRVQDFITHMLINGRGYHIRAGTVATGVAMDSTLTDTDAEMCVDAAAGTTIIPINFAIAFDEIATATTVRVAVKAVGTASNAGTAFVPIPLLQGGSNCTATARVQNNGAVQVPAEVFDQTSPLTACRRLFQFNAVYTQTPATDLGSHAGPPATIAAAVADLNYVGKGVACVYVQAAATTAFPLYFASLDFLEIPTANL
jgi:hypothetical protein